MYNQYISLTPQTYITNFILDIFNWMPNNHLVQPTILLLPNSSTSQVLTSAYFSLPGKNLNVKALSFPLISHIQSMNVLPLLSVQEGKKKKGVLCPSQVLIWGSVPKDRITIMKTISLLTCISHILEKGTATHSSILAWRIPWMEEPGGLQSMGSQRVRHD